MEDLIEEYINTVTNKESTAQILREFNTWKVEKLKKGGKALEILPTKEYDIESTTFELEEATTEEQRKQGLMFRKELLDNRGMIFIFDEIGTHEMYMKDTTIPLLQIWIDENWKVLKVEQRKPKDETLIGCEGSKYVIEINPNFEVEKGDDVYPPNQDEKEGPVMKVLAPDGSSLMDLWGGERIVSRRETLVLIRKAKKAYELKENESEYTKKCKSLGKYIFKVLSGLESRDPEYVQGPD